MKHNAFEKSKRQSGMVRVRGGFSDSNGISLCNTDIQVDEFDDDTRVQINNKLFSIVDFAMKDNGHVLVSDTLNGNKPHQFCKHILNDVFCESNFLDDRHYYDWYEVYKQRIENVIIDATYNEVLDIVEYICNWISLRIVGHYSKLPYTAMNNVFEEEYVGYRFVDGRIVAITDENEISSIEASLSIPFNGSRVHFQKAVGFLADREIKDYKNSIKESISAVESACQQITENGKATLGEALGKLEDKGISMHPALKSAFSKLYGYTSDQGGIRHAEGMFESNVTFEEAKFMLVSCSAFVNYLIAEYGKRSK